MLHEYSYDTTIGKTMPIDKTKEDIIKYLISVNHTNLSYEFMMDGKTKLVIICGCNENERRIPLFEHPIIINHNNKLMVAIDVRNYVKLEDDNCPIKLKDVVSKLPEYTNLLLRAMLTADFMDDNYEKVSGCYKSIITSFGLFIGNRINSIIGLEPIEKVAVEAISMYYMTYMLTNSTPSDNLKATNTARVLNCKASVPVPASHIRTILEPITFETLTLDDLLAYIRAVLPIEKTSFINKNVLINSINNQWFGPGGAITLAMSLEDAAAWTSLLYSAGCESVFHRTRLAEILNKYKSNINLTDVEKIMSLYINDHIV